MYTGFSLVFKVKLWFAHQPLLVLSSFCSYGEGDHTSGVCKSGEGAFTQALKHLYASVTAYLLMYMLCLGAVSQAESRLVPVYTGVLQSQAQQTAAAVLIIVHKSMLIHNASKVL